MGCVMKRKKELSIIEFLLYDVIAFMIIFIHIKNLLGLQNYLAMVSLMIFVFIMLAEYIFIGLRYSCIFFSPMISLGIVTMVSYFNEYILFSIIVTLMFILFMIIFGAIVIKTDQINIVQARTDREYRTDIFRAISYKFLKTAYVYVSVFVIGVIAFIYLVPYFNVDSGYEYTESKETDMGDILSQIRDVNESNWQDSSFDEKKKICENIFNIEIRHLGIRNKLYFEIANLESKHDGLEGEYIDLTKRIIISDALLKSDKYTANHVLSVICHEVFHAYSYELVEIYNNNPDLQNNLFLFRDIKDFSEELSSNKYISGEDDEKYFEYYDQLCERRAREYGDLRVSQYITAINFEKEETSLMYVKAYIF